MPILEFIYEFISDDHVNSYTNSYKSFCLKFQIYTNCPLTGPASQVAPAASLLIFQEEDGPDADGDHGAPDPSDDADFGFCAAAAQAAAGTGPMDPGPLDPLTSYIMELGPGELSSMSGPDISLPVPASANEDHPLAFTRSERILQDFQRVKRI